MRITLFLVVACPLFGADARLMQGISHVGFRVADLEKTRAYYTGVLHLQQAYGQKDASGKPTLAVFKINDRQFLEFSPGTPAGFTHLAFLTEKLAAMHNLAASLGLNPPELRTGHDRTRNFSIKDPDGQRIEFVEYEPDSMQAQSRGKFKSDVVFGIDHVGLPVADRGAATTFFAGQLHLEEIQPGMLRPPGERERIELLPAGSAVHLGMLVGDESPPRSGHDPDGIAVDIVGVN